MLTSARYSHSVVCPLVIAAWIAMSLTVSGCEGQSYMDDIPVDGGSTWTTLEVVSYHTLPGIDDVDVEDALNAGATWSELEHGGMIEIEQFYTDLVPVISLSDEATTSPASKARTEVGVGGLYDVSGGSTVNFIYDATPDTCYFMFGYGLRANSTTNTIGSGDARSDYFKRVSGQWSWVDYDLSGSGGTWQDLVWCGSNCTKVRNKVTNRTSSLHDYGSALYTESDSECGH